MYNVINKSTFIFLAIFFVSCGKIIIKHDNETVVTKTPIQINRSFYSFLKDSFGFSYVENAGNLYGALTPEYSMAIGVKTGTNEDCIFYDGCTDLNGYFLIISDSCGYKILKSWYDLMTTFAPIETAEEALSYACLATGLKPRYSFDIPDQFRIFVKEINTTYSVKIDDGFEVALFDYIVSVHNVRSLRYSCLENSHLQ